MEEQDRSKIDDALLGQEKKGIDYYLEQMKLTAFQVLYVLRKDEDQEEGIFLFFFFNGIDYFQMHQFPFYVTIYYLWKQDTFMEFINQVQNLFQISNYIPSLTYESLLLTVYILLFFILLIIADIMYVSYSFSKNRFQVMWPLYILRSIASYVVTVLFLPITETLTAILQCAVDPETGQYAIYGYNNIHVECWVGWHTFHALVDLTFIMIFVFICAIVAYAFFEPSMTSKDRSARQDSKGEVAFITNKITCQLMYSLLRPNYPEQAWLMVIITFILSLWLAYIYNFDDPYYDFQVGLFYNICSTYYLWASFMLLVCKVLESTSFTGGFVAWCIGLPFIVSIMYMTKKSKIETLIRSQTKFRSGAQMWSHIRYVLQLIQNQARDKNSYMLLVGYIEKHKETCVNDDCPLKLQGKKKNKRTQQLDMQEQIRGLILELDKMFVNGLKKFPSSVELRIFYALFLMERRNNKTKALEHFELAQQYKPALYQQFIIYRYKKDLKKGNKNEGDDIVNAIAFNNHLMACEEMMKFSATLHKEFWIELKEDQPDLGRLMNIGARISVATNSAKENYYKMQKLNPNVPQTIKVFGTFMLNVLNDSRKGSELLNLSKQVKDLLKKNQAHKDEFLQFEPTHVPFIYVSAKKADQGNILVANPLFTSFFGYSKEEIQGKKINILMPQKYSENHDKYMNVFFDNLILNRREEADIDSEYLDVDQNRLFKHKNGYIFPVIYKVSLHIESLVYITTFKGEPSLKTSVHFIVDKNSQIIEMSSSAITFFDIELKQLNEKIRLNDYIQDVLSKNNKDVIAKLPKKEIRFYFNCIVREITLPKKNRDDSIDEDNKQELERTGYYMVRLDKIEKNEANLKYLQKKHANSGSLSSPMESDQVIQIGSQSKLLGVNSSNDSQLPLIKEAENIDVDQDYMIYMQDLYDNPKVDEFKDLFKNAVAETDSVPSIDYTENIVIKRLINGQIVSINEEYEEQILQKLEEEEEENSIFRNLNNNFEDEDDYKLFQYSNSAVLITNALNAHHRHYSISIFKLYSSLWIIFILTVTTLQYYFCAQQFQLYKADLQILQIVNTQLVEINKITSRVLDFCINQLSLYDYNETLLQDDIFGAAQSIIEFNSYINSEQYLQFSGYYDKMIDFRFYQNSSYYTNGTVTLESSILLLAALALNSSLAENIGLNNIYALGVIQNFFNVINTEIINISATLYTSIKDIFDNPQVDLLILLATSIFVSLMAMTKFILLMFDIKTQRENVLFLFLDIPTTHVELLYRKCDKFLKTYVSVEELRNKNEMEGYESSEDEGEQHQEQVVIKVEMSQDEEDTLLRQSQNRRKIIKKYRQNRLKGNQNIIIQFFIISLFTLIFTVYNILSSQSEQSQINFIIPQYYQSIYNTNNYAFYLNLQKLMMMNYSIEINNQPITELVLNNLTIFTGNAQKQNAFAHELLGKMDSFRNIYINVYYGDLCQYVNTSECPLLINENLQMGLYNVESYYLNFFRQNLENFYDEMQKNSVLLGSTELYEIDRSLYNYVFQAVDYMTNFEQNLVISDMDSTQYIQMILLIVFIVLLLGIFLFIWLPFLEGLNTQINQTIEMLNMIPVNVIKENKSIRRFVKKLIKSTQISQ